MPTIIRCKICGEPMPAHHFFDSLSECKSDGYSIYRTPKETNYECIIIGDLFFHYTSGERNAFISSMDDQNDQTPLLTIPMPN